MIIQRNTFHLKFGKAKEAIAIWKEMLEASRKLEGVKMEFRLMTDLSGHSYTLVLEMKLRSFTEINPKNYVWVTNSDFQELYQKFIPLCESGTREYFKIEMET